jgi:hypothetical protein
VPRSPGATILPVRVVYHSDLLDVKAVHGIGFRARCGCGWEGRVRRQRTFARADLHWHQHDTHNPEGVNA